MKRTMGKVSAGESAQIFSRHSFVFGTEGTGYFSA